MNLSIAICTYNRAERLKNLLEDLCNQTIDKNLFEVIIIDNASGDNTKQTAAIYSDRLNIVYGYEPRQGLSYARNLGIKLAKALYIAYLDDDVRLNKDLVSVVLNIVEKCGADIFGGSVFPYYENKKPAWFLDKYATFSYWGENIHSLGENEYLSGGNIIFKKMLLEKLGGFDTALGMCGRRMGYHEEADIVKRAKKAYPQINIMYFPDIRISHLVPSYKMSLTWRIKRSYYTAKSNIILNEKEILDDKTPFFVLFKNVGYQIMVILFKGITAIVCRNRNKYRYYQNFFMERVMYNLDSLFNNLSMLLCRKKIK